MRYVGDDEGHRTPVLLVPSMINRWYILDLRPGFSITAALVDAGFDVWCLDWGVSGDEDRYLTWDRILARLSRAVRRVARATGHDRVGVLGYCMGATLSAIHAALEPDSVAWLVNLAGPIDFSTAGMLRRLVDPRWFDVDAIADAGNVSPRQMQEGFAALRPTLKLSKWVTLADRLTDDAFLRSFTALEHWANDNIPFPAAAYRTYIRELYQENRLVEGGHRVGGRSVDLAQIDCPILTITASRDTICPPEAALALPSLASSTDTTHVSVPGGHVGAVVGSRAATKLYPALTAWLRNERAAA